MEGIYFFSQTKNFHSQLIFHSVQCFVKISFNVETGRWKVNLEKTGKQKILNVLPGNLRRNGEVIDIDLNDLIEALPVGNKPSDVRTRKALFTVMDSICTDGKLSLEEVSYMPILKKATNMCYHNSFVAHLFRLWEFFK